MSIANELSVEVATALLVNRKGDPAELLRIVKGCHFELRRLSFSESFDGPKQSDKLVGTSNDTTTGGRG